MRHRLLPLILLAVLASAQAKTALATSERVSLKCTEVHEVPADIRAALPYLDLPMPEWAQPLEVCVSPTIHHGTYQFRVVSAYHSVFCNARGACSVNILGHTDNGRFLDLTEPVVLHWDESGVIVRRVPKRAGAGTAGLDIEFPEGTFRWQLKNKRFEYFSKSEIGAASLATP